MQRIDSILDSILLYFSVVKYDHILDRVLYRVPSCCILYLQVAVVNGELKAFTEYERRETYVAIMDRFEKKLFLLLVQESLDNDPDRRPSSPDVLKRMEEILSKIPAVSASAKTSTGIIIEATDSDRPVEAPDSDRAAELSKQLQVTTPTGHSSHMLIASF